jgi:hypothetical protein
MKVLIESDILDTAHREVLVSLDDDGNVVVHLLVRDGSYGPQALTVLALKPEEAHMLGNKLRLAAKKVER